GAVFLGAGVWISRCLTQRMVGSSRGAETSFRICRGQPGPPPDHHRQRSCTRARCASSRRAWVPQAREPVRGGSLMLIPFTIVALLALMLSGPANAQVHVDIGISLPAPPQLVVVPGAPAVRYAPAAPANFFFYGGQYWVFHDGGWPVRR